MIKIENLSVAFDGVEVVRNVSLEIADGEILGLVGESGSGKSITALTLMGLVSEDAVLTSGRILYDGVVLAEAGKKRDKALYREYQGPHMSMIFQEPMTSLNPTQRAGAQVDEVLRLHTDMQPEKRRQLILEAFQRVGLHNPEKVYTSYPHQLSGGMRQRVMIAMAVIMRPGLVVADEPTTALDVTVQSQIVTLLAELNKEQKNAMLFITHDLNLAKRLCNRIAVMRDGKVVESGSPEDIFHNPREEYTKKLIQAVPTRMKPKRAQAVSEDAILKVEHLDIYYQEGSNSLFGRHKKRQVVEDASFIVHRGETLGLVGESGCGKTSLSKAILGMHRDIRGTINHYSQGPQMIFQDPYGSLNPSKTIGWLLQEPLRAAGKIDRQRALSGSDREAAAYDMLKKVGLDEKYYHRYPSQLSGGQRQRVSIAQALITRPGLVIADEPVSALDVTLQAQIMELMRALQEEMQLSYLFISHDINIIYKMSDRVMVMKSGRIIESGVTKEIFEHPKEEYTRLLLEE